jgi:hypothetical protein
MQLITGVKVGMQVVPVDAPFVVVIHQVVGCWEVVRQTRGPVVELDGAEVVIVVEGVLDAEVWVVDAGVALVEGVSVVEGAALEGAALEGAALEGESVEAAAEGESLVKEVPAVVCAPVVCAGVVLGSAAVVLASVAEASELAGLFFCLFLKSRNASSLIGTTQCSEIDLEIVAASFWEQPLVTRHCSKRPNWFDSTEAETHLATTLRSHKPYWSSGSRLHSSRLIEDTSADVAHRPMRIERIVVSMAGWSQVR